MITPADAVDAGRALERPGRLARTAPPTSTTFPGVWRHGDWIVFTERGSSMITGRSDATLNRGGVRLGTSEFYVVVEELDEVLDSLVVHLDDPDELLLFVALREGVELDDELRARIAGCSARRSRRATCRTTIVAVPAIPRTLTGKKLELPVKRILAGADVGGGGQRGRARRSGLDRRVRRLRARAPRLMALAAARPRPRPDRRPRGDEGLLLRGARAGGGGAAGARVPGLLALPRGRAVPAPRRARVLRGARGDARAAGRRGGRPRRLRRRGLRARSPRGWRLPASTR